MIIGIDASRANKQKKTGTEWYSYYIIEKIKNLADHNDQIILYSKEKLTGPLANLPENFKSRVLRWPPKFLWTQLRLAWEVTINRPDVLFVPSHTIPILCPKKTITTLHDIGFEKFKHLYSQKNIGPRILGVLIKIITFGKYSNTELDYHRWSARLALKKAKKIITVSQFSKDEIIKKYNVNAEIVNVIHNAYSPAYKKINDDAKINSILAKYSVNKPFFLFIGRLEEKKNVAGILEGYYKYIQKGGDQVKIVLIGNPGYGYEKISGVIKKYSLSNNIIQPGWIDNDELPFIMNAATAFIFPSFYEGFGLPILEAMACGVPVITSNFGATKEVADNAAFFVNPHNSEEIAHGMFKVATDRKLRESLIKRGYNRIEQFSWQSSAEKTLNLIHNI
jgi:glycosyltransferase involved in cell wall biosynthesis